MQLIGLTGGIASGKSTVSAMLVQEHGIPVIDADLIAREVVQPGKFGWWRLRKRFGDDIFNPDGTLNREKMGQMCFSDPKARAQLNRCLHKLILLKICRKIMSYYLIGTEFVILDVPLLFECRWTLRFLLYTVVVYCENEEERVRRILKRNPNLSENDARMRIKAQMKNQDLLSRCDFCIDNSKDIEYTREQVQSLVTKIRLSKVFKCPRKYCYSRI